MGLRLFCRAGNWPGGGRIFSGGNGVFKGTGDKWRGNLWVSTRQVRKWCWKSIDNLFLIRRQAVSNLRNDRFRVLCSSNSIEGFNLRDRSKLSRISVSNGRRRRFHSLCHGSIN